MITREFELADGSTFSVTWNTPEADGNDYRCDYVFNLKGQERRSHAFGVDAVQALLLALGKAHIDLLASPEGRSSEIKWLGLTDLGLPLPSSVSAENFQSPSAD